MRASRAELFQNETCYEESATCNLRAAEHKKRDIYNVQCLPNRCVRELIWGYMLIIKMHACAHCVLKGRCSHHPLLDMRKKQCLSFRSKVCGRRREGFGNEFQVWKLGATHFFKDRWEQIGIIGLFRQSETQIGIIGLFRQSETQFGKKHISRSFPN